MMLEMMSQMAALPFWVRLWMGWMMALFLFAAIFARRDADARAILAAFILSMALGMGFFAVTRSVRMIAAGHLLVWTPLLVHLHKTRFNGGEQGPRGLRKAWLRALRLTVLTSLLFDLREVALHLYGR